ncbi:hypothetical protein AB1L88_13000 [Tautonia sp. JC769]|uniref:hypothetical protein n=1 Tax=Tautonia sp. JC769 TaxID=3232135 RepID=UPI00345AD248
MDFKEFEIALSEKLDQVESAIRERGMASLQAEEYSLRLKDDCEVIYPDAASDEQQARAVDLMYRMIEAIDPPGVGDEEALAALQEVRTRLKT